MRRHTMLWVLFVAPFFPPSCKKQNAACPTCNIKKEAYKIDLSYSSLSGNLEFKNAKIWSSDDAGSALLFADLPKDNYTDLNNGISLLTRSNLSTFITILYVEKTVEKDKLLSDDNISAVSRISKSGNTLHHDFFERINEGFVKNDYLSIDIPFITTNALFYISNSIVFSGKTATSIMFFNNSDEPAFETKIKKSRDILINKAKLYNKFFNKNPKGTGTIFRISPDDFDEQGKCPKPCDEGDKKSCRWSTGQSKFICMSNTSSCGSSDIETKLLDEQLMHPDSVGFAYNEPLQYSFRDSILHRSDFGLKFIYYYYELSGAYAQLHTVSSMLNATAVLITFNASVNKLLNPAGHENDIFLTSSMKHNISALITQYRNIYSDVYLNAIFDDIMNDLNWAENRTVSQVLTRF